MPSRACLNVAAAAGCLSRGLLVRLLRQAGHAQLQNELAAQRAAHELDVLSRKTLADFRLVAG